MRITLLILITGLSLLLSCKKAERVKLPDPCAGLGPVSARFKVQYTINYGLLTVPLFVDSVNRNQYFNLISDYRDFYYSGFAWTYNNKTRYSQASDWGIDKNVLPLGINTISCGVARNPPDSACENNSDSYSRTVVVMPDTFTYLKGKFALGDNYSDTLEIYFNKSQNRMRFKANFSCISTDDILWDYDMYSVLIDLHLLDECGGLVYQIFIENQKLKVYKVYGRANFTNIKRL